MGYFRCQHVKLYYISRIGRLSKLPRVPWKDTAQYQANVPQEIIQLPYTHRIPTDITVYLMSQVSYTNQLP